MARRPIGQVLERDGARGTTFALRFRAYGKRRYVTLGGDWEGCTRQRAEVERARGDAQKRGERFDERGLNNGTINKTLTRLAQILEAAVDYGLIPANPAVGKRRRLKAERPRRPWVEPEQLPTLLDCATGL